MPAVAENLGSGHWLVRVGQGCNKMHDPYEWTCVVAVSGQSAMIKGVDKKPTPSVRRDLERCLREMGCLFCGWERVRKDGSIRSSGPFFGRGEP